MAPKLYIYSLSLDQLSNVCITFVIVKHLLSLFVEYGIYLTGGTHLDYDSTPSYSLTVQCSDFRRQSTGNFTLNIVRNEVR